MNEYIKKITFNDFIKIVLFTITAFVFLIIFSYTTSPLYKENLGIGDSSIFMCLGQFMRKGLVPYVDFWDHKGPVIYFIEYIGTYIEEGTIGVFMLQIVFMVFSLYGIYKILNIFCYGKKQFFIMFLLSVLIGILMEGGNLTEEYCLPFLVWSTFFATKYMYSADKGVTHSKKYGFFYGVTFMICTFTRITNALLLCCLILVGLITMCLYKQWKDILYNFIAFTIGFVTSATPIIVYCLTKDNIKEMIYGTFIYNLRYAKNTTNMDVFSHLIGVKWVSLIVVLSFTIAFMYFCIHKRQRQKRILASLIILSCTMILIMILKSEAYYHYYLVYIPVFTVVLGVASESLAQNAYKKIILMIIVFLSIVLVIKNCFMVIDMYKVYSENYKHEEYKEEAQSLIKNIIEEDRKSVLCYNVESQFYLRTDLVPCYKYFILQDWQGQHDKELYNEIEDYFNSGEAKYIVTKKESNGAFQDIIEEKYNIVNNTDNFLLYQKK